LPARDPGTRPRRAEAAGERAPGPHRGHRAAPRSL